MRVAVVTHSSPRVGVGHLRRCLTLAGALRASGGEPIFVLGPDQSGAELVEARGFEPVVLPAHEGRCIAAALSLLNPELVVVDSYDLGADDLDAFGRVARVAVIDDLADRDLRVELVWNGGVQADHRLYEGRIRADTRLLLGLDYALLAPEYRTAGPRMVRDRVDRVLLTVGGSDPVGALPLLLRAIRRAAPHASVDVVVGPYAAAPVEAIDDPSLVTLHHAPPSLLPLMQEADLAVSAGGQTTYELAATGTPAVLVWSAENQIPQTLAFEGRGTVRCSGDVREGAAAETRVALTVAALAADPAARRALSRAGQACLDGLGPERTAKALLALGEL
jgi:UDP-2,4-diacetamido-2,4,6-trideoxy-beta-L-altropyranose hydrolase